MRRLFSAYAAHPPIGCDICAVLTRVAFWFGITAGVAGTTLLMALFRLFRLRC